MSIHQPRSTIKNDLPADYDERVYAGILGKLIGVYLGRPIENWTYERITRELGEGIATARLAAYSSASCASACLR